MVLVVDFLRGIQSDCGSPPQLSNGQLIRDALDGVAHLAGLPSVDSKRIYVLGTSKGALVATWLASSAVANAVRPGTPQIAGAVSLYGFCGLGPTRGRPEGVRILQNDTDRPLLMLLGGKDAETPPDSCLQQLPRLKSSGAPVQWHLYPDATHAWDAKEKDGFSKRDFKNERVVYSYSKSVTDDSIARTFDFLAQSRPGN